MAELKEKGQTTMKQNGKILLFLGSIFIGAFIMWTLLIQKVDVQPLGLNGTNIGFATINYWFHKLTGVHGRSLCRKRISSIVD